MLSLIANCDLLVDERGGSGTPNPFGKTREGVLDAPTYAKNAHVFSEKRSPLVERNKVHFINLKTIFIAMSYNFGFLNLINQDTLAGKIRSVSYQFNIKLQRNKNKRSASSPEYNLFIVNQNGEFESGSVWENSKDGKTFLSLVVDNPSMPAPLRLAGFLNEDKKSFKLVWSREDVGNKNANSLIDDNVPM